MYDALNDSRTRPAHAAMDNMVFRHDDPIWDTHYPPNGFGCRCRVRALTAKEVEARGLAVSDSKGKLHQVEQRVGMDKRTGEIIKRPATQYRTDGVNMAPDPGWNYNPGAGGADPGSLPPVRIPPPNSDPKINSATRKSLGLPAALPPAAARPKKIAMPDGASIEERVATAERALAVHGSVPIAVTRSDGVKDILYHRVPTPEGLDDVWIAQSTIRHTVAEKPIGDRERWANFVLPTLRDPGEVWLQGRRDERGRTIYGEVYFSAYPDADMLVLARPDPKLGNIAWTFYPLSSKAQLEKRRAGKLLYRKTGKKGG